MTEKKSFLLAVVVSIDSDKDRTQHPILQVVHDGDPDLQRLTEPVQAAHNDHVPGPEMVQHLVELGRLARDPDALSAKTFRHPAALRAFFSPSGRRSKC